MIDYHKMFLDNDELFVLFLGCEDFKKNMATSINCDGQNILHLAISVDNWKMIKKLIESGCSMLKQDFWGRTPLHLALAYNHQQCIDMFIKEYQTVIDEYEAKNELNKQIFMHELKLALASENENNFEKKHLDNLIHLFEVYNHDGYTVLHLAINFGNLALIGVMLKFAKIFQINIEEHGTLGSGDSILQVAVQNGNRDIVKLIVENFPELVTYPNYSKSIPKEDNTFIDIMN